MGKRFVEMTGSAEAPIPGQNKELSGEVRIGYNANDEMIRIRKVVGGKVFERDITDPRVIDNVVSYWVVYSEYSEI